MPSRPNMLIKTGHRADEYLAASGIGTEQDPYVLNVQSGRGDLAGDAWGRQKVINDHSILHGMFTHGIPTSFWREVVNSVESTTFINSYGDSGKAIIAAGATPNDDTSLETFRHARYEPNRGQLYSSSVLLPNPTDDGLRDFGIFTPENGVFFRLKSDGNLYACRRTTNNGGPTTTTTEELIDLSGIPSLDLSKGNIYDIQMQWRGVGNIKFFIGNPDTGLSELVHTMSLLGTLDELSISNPTLPICFRSENLGDNVQIECGCVDVTTEGGVDLNHMYGSISIDNESGQITIPGGFNIPILAVRNKETAPNGRVNVRDVQAFYINAYGDQRCFLRVWVTRDPTAITINDQSWRDFGDGFMEFIQYDNPDVTTPMSFDTTKATLTFGARVNQDTTLTSPALFDDKAKIHVTPGDILVFTMHRENGGSANVGCTFEFGQEI